MSFDAFANPLRSMVVVVRVKLLCSTVLSELKMAERDQYGWQSVTVNPRFKCIPVNDLIWEGMEQLTMAPHTGKVSGDGVWDPEM